MVTTERQDPETRAADGPVPPGNPVRSVVQHLRLVYRSIQEHSRWVEKQCGVSAAQLWTLWELQASPGLRVSELSEALSIHPSTASNVLDKLENKGLIRRSRGGPDQRVVRLYLTEQGKEVLARAPLPVQGALMDGLQRLPAGVLAELEHALARLVTAMEIRNRDAALRPMDDD